MSSFEVLVLGVGDSFSERHHSTSVLMCCDGFWIGIDCPDMYRGALRSAAERSGRALTLSEIDHVLITHVHGDHMNGLEGAAYFKHFAEKKRLGLITSAELRATIWDERLAASMGTLWTGSEFRRVGFDDYFEHTALSWHEAIQVGPFRIRARRTVHHVPTSALFIEAGGR
nr:MBL fold metallo-hydrolase [Polyangiaceae bacterium]